MQVSYLHRHFLLFLLLCKVTFPGLLLLLHLCHPLFFCLQRGYFSSSVTRQLHKSDSCYDIKG